MLMSHNDVPSHLAVCGVKIGQCDGVFAEKHRPKALVLPDHNYTGTDAYNRPDVHFHMQYRLLRECLSLNCGQCGGFNMIEKIVSLVQQASPFVPKGSLSGHIPETLSQRRNMNKRTYEIKVRLAADEMAYLNQLVAASGLSRETYLRMLISGVVPKEAPPPDFWAMMRELHAIGNNLNQIAMNTHVLNAIDAKHYDEGVRLFQDAVQNILSAVLDPIPIDKLTQGRAEAPVPNDERNDVYRKEVM